MNQNEELSKLDEEKPQLSQLSILQNNESSHSSMSSLTIAQRTRGKERIYSNEFYVGCQFW